MPLRTDPSPIPSPLSSASLPSGAGVLDWLGDKLDFTGHLRYGMSTADKEALASAGSLPGAPVDRTADQARANRYASGYLFGREHPTLAPMIQPLIDMIETTRAGPFHVPIIGGQDPSLQMQATMGVMRGSAPLSAPAYTNPLRSTVGASPTPMPAPPPPSYARR